MGKALDLTGQKFTRLTVIKKVENKKINTQWLCRCDCGKIKKIITNSLRTGKTKSCGCLNIEKIKEKNIKHGFTSNYKLHPLYIKWINMKQRCYNQNYTYYNYYGGRGIKICDKWKNDPAEFIEWAKGNGWKPQLEIDRIDNNGNYSPENCRFVERNVNASNIRIPKRNTSGYIGVHFHKRDNNFEASITINNKVIYLGSFISSEHAAIARNNYIINNNLPHTLNTI